MDEKDYFNFKFTIKKNKPIFQIKLKEEFKICKQNCKDGKMPISTSSIKYFCLYFENLQIAEKLYKFYKQFFNKKNAFKWFLNNRLISTEEISFCVEYFKKIEEKMIFNHKKVINSEEYRSTLKKSYNHELQSKIKKKLYQNEEYKLKIYKATQNPEVKKRRVESYKKWLANGGIEQLKIAANKPERIKKIRYWSKFYANKLQRDLNFPKKYELNSYKMTKIEFVVGNILNDLKINWEYESPLLLNNKWFYPDFSLGNNLIIECYGDYWHANPDNTKRVDKEEIWEKDKTRIDTLISNGYKILTLWESEILKLNKKEIQEKIERFIKMNIENNIYKEEEITLKNLFERYGISSFDEVGMLSLNDEIEIESYDIVQNKTIWSKLTDLVVKPSVDSFYVLGSLKGTANHKVWFNNQWIELKDHPGAVKVDGKMDVLDLSVENTNCYLAEGQINHNTTTPGGMAIPFAASVRLRVYTPQKIKELVEKQEVIKGIQVRVATVKNKVARPYRQAELQILYDKGINDYEILFDDLRVFCESPKYKENRERYAIDGICGNISGSGAWKKIELINCSTGEIKAEKSFYKADFATIFNDPKYKDYIFMLCDGAFILKDNEKDEISVASGVQTDEHSLD